VRNLARRLLGTPELRDANSLQLAAALTWCRQRRAKRFCVRRSTTIQGRNSGWFLRPGILSSGTSRSCLETFISPMLPWLPTRSRDRFLITFKSQEGINAKERKQVILVGNVGKDPESGIHRAALRSRISPSPPTKGSKIETTNGRTGRSGTTSWLGSVWRRSLGSTSPKAPRCTSKASSRPQAGRTGRAERGNTALKSSLATCSCSARGETAAATTNVRRTMRIRTSLPTPTPAKLWTRIFHSEAVGKFLHILTKGELS